MDNEHILKVIEWNIYIFLIIFHKNLFFLFYIFTFQNTSYQIIYFVLHFINISIFLDF